MSKTRAFLLGFLFLILGVLAYNEREVVSILFLYLSGRLLELP